MLYEEKKLEKKIIYTPVHLNTPVFCNIKMECNGV